MTSLIFFLSPLHSFHSLSLPECNYQLISIDSVTYETTLPADIQELESQWEKLKLSSEDIENSELEDKETRQQENANAQTTIQQAIKERKQAWRRDYLSISMVSERAFREINEHISQRNPSQIIFVGEDILGCSVVMELATRLEQLASHTAFLLLSAAPIHHTIKKSANINDEEEELPSESQDIELLFNQFDGYAKENDVVTSLFTGSTLDEERIESIIGLFFNEENIPSWSREYIQKQSPEARLGFLESLVENQFHDQMVVLKQLKSPVKVIVGAEDSLLNETFMKSLSSKIPTLVKREVIVIPGSKHFVSIEKPDAIKQQLANLVDICEIITSPQDITGRWIDQMILIGVPSLEVHDIHVEQFGEGCIGSLSRISFEIADKQLAFRYQAKIPHKSFVLKIQPKTDGIIKQIQIHKRESLFYSTVARLIPRLSDLSVPKTFAILEEDTIVVMEDLKQGIPLPIDEPLNWSDAEVMMKLLAIFHSLPFSGSAKEHEWRNAMDVYESLGLNDAMSYNCILVELVPETWSKIKSNFQRIDESSVERLVSKSRILQYLDEKVNLPPDLESLNYLLIHGDLFSANILKRCDLQDLHHTIVDFQFSHFGLPFQELAFFLYSSVDHFTLMRHELDLLKLYYNHLRRLTRDTFETLTFDMFHTYFKKYGKLGGLYQLIASWNVYDNSEKHSVMERFQYALNDVLQYIGN